VKVVTFTAAAGFVMANPPIIELLNKVDFDEHDFQALFDMLRADPTCASQLGSHHRSTIWVCCQHSECEWRRFIIPPLLVHYGASVNIQADNGFTPLESLYEHWTEAKEHKRAMAFLLVHVLGADVNNNEINDWLSQG